MVPLQSLDQSAAEQAMEKVDKVEGLEIVVEAEVY